MPSTYKLIPTKIESKGDIAVIEGIVENEYGRFQVSQGYMLIKEKGRWKFYGNQK